MRAKGISEKAITDKSAAEKPVEKPADKPAETASIPVSRSGGHPPSSADAARKGRRQERARDGRRSPSLWLPRRIPSRRSKPRSSLRMPTIWRARRSSACAARLRLRRVAQETAREAARVPEAPRVVAAPAPAPVQCRRFSRCRRQFWSPRRRPKSRAAKPRLPAHGAVGRSGSSDAAGRYSGPAAAARFAG